MKSDIKNKIRSDAFVLLQLNKEDFSSTPDGNVIKKHYIQEKTLSDGSKQTYTYDYEFLDYEGWQVYLPKRNPESHLWKLKDEILEKRSIEKKKKAVHECLIENIKVLYNCKDRKAEQHLSKILEKAEKEIENKKDYEKTHIANEKNETEKNFLTAKGRYVRSKNEMIFEKMLDEFGMQYLYEVQLSTWYMGKLFPDFTIFVNDDFIHVELLGKLDDKEYCSNFEIKQKKYKKVREKVLYLDVTDGIEIQKLENALNKILNSNLNALNGKLIRCAPDTAKRTSLI